jgi:hypothetical protein
MTDGAVSDATAQMWANASNRDSGWFQWAEANDQTAFLLTLVGPADIAPNEEQALAAGASVALPACDLYPTANALFPITDEDQKYFARKGLPTDDRFVLVVKYLGPCSEVVHYPNGSQQTLQISTAPDTVFLPGRVETLAELGSIWFVDAGGNCNDPAGPPPEWCSR